MAATQPIAGKALISLGRTNKKWRRFVVKASGFLSYTPRAAITSPPNFWECKNPPKVITDSLILVFARPLGHGHHGETDNITITVTNANTGDTTAIAPAEVAYSDDDDPTLKPKSVKAKKTPGPTRQSANRGGRPVATNA